MAISVDHSGIVGFHGYMQPTIQETLNLAANSVQIYHRTSDSAFRVVNLPKDPFIHVYVYIIISALPTLCLLDPEIVRDKSYFND